MRAVIALDPALGLPRARGDDLVSIGEFDVVPKASELPNHSLRSASLGSFVDGRASFLVTHALVQNLPNESAQSVGDDADRLVVPKARHVTLGMPELIVIFVIAEIVFGPRRLPELGHSLGRSIAEFKKAVNDMQSTLEDEVRAEERRTAAAATAVSGAALAPTDAATANSRRSA